MANEVATIETRATQLAEKIEVLVTEARQKVASVTNTAQVYTYYEIGCYIVEDEQGGKVRAEYGKGVLKRVSEHLTERLGKGWSEENLRLMRKFYTLYSHWQSPINKIQTNGLEIQSPKIQTTGSEIQSTKLEPEFGSGFSYRQLKFCRQFYRTYPIGNTLRSQLNWSQYRKLIQIDDPDKREYYEL